MEYFPPKTRIGAVVSENLMTEQIVSQEGESEMPTGIKAGVMPLKDALRWVKNHVCRIKCGLSLETSVDPTCKSICSAKGLSLKILKR